MPASRSERIRLGGVFAALVVANVGAWAWAWTAFSHSPTLLGSALLAWAFGLRHALDADHIAAIDNVVRKLIGDGQRPWYAGFFFSSGHSSVVILACVVILLTASALPLTQFKDAAGTIGVAVSGTFLLLIAAMNMVVLRGTWRSVRAVRRGEPAPADGMLEGQGLIARVCRPLFRMIRRSWQMYPLGFLFGMGFDTATEIGLLSIAASQASTGLSPWDVLVFPALFTAAMVLADTADSALMTGAYRWALVHPLRKLWYNLTITAASVAVALVIGGIEVLGLLADRFGNGHGVWAALGGLGDDLAHAGFAVVAVFLGAWALSVLVYRIRGYDRITAQATD